MYKEVNSSTVYERRNKRKQLNYPLTEEQISKLWCSREMEYYTLAKMHNISIVYKLSTLVSFTSIMNFKKK